MSSTIASIASETVSAVASATTSAEAAAKPAGLKVVGVILAITSGLLIGASFVFKKKGLLQSQEKGAVLGEGVAYLKSWLWWVGMVMMILGELCNFAAYAFVDAVVVTPLGALSVVICAILSSIFLKETLTFFGWVGCGLAIVGSIIIALNGPKEQAVSTISEFQKLFFAPGFLVFGSVLIIGSLVIIFFFAPKHGKTNMIWYIAVCSMIGGLSVSCIQGLGAAIVTTAQGHSQFKQWFTYFLLVFVTVTLLTEIYYLNVALALFNTAMVTPTYYVIFTGCTLITSVVLYQGLKSTITEILTVVMGFFVICAGIVILQMSKVDPEKLGKLDRRSTILLKANSQHVETQEKGITGMEDPGMDALRGTFGAVGSIIRARSARRLSMASRNSEARPTPRGMRTDLESGPQGDSSADTRAANRLSTHGLEHLPRHQLYDAPVRPSTDTIDSDDTISELPPRNILASPRHQPTIKFGDADVAHYYPSPGKRGEAIHESRGVGPPIGQSGYPVSATQRSPFGEPTSNTARTAPASQTSFGSIYANPFNSPPHETSSRALPPSSRSTLMSDLSTGRDSPDGYDSPPEPRRTQHHHQQRSYPMRGSEDREEQQRLVSRRDTSSPDDDFNGGGARPGAVRLLPTLPKMDPL